MSAWSLLLCACSKQGHTEKQDEVQLTPTLRTTPLMCCPVGSQCITVNRGEQLRVDLYSRENTWILKQAQSEVGFLHTLNCVLMSMYKDASHNIKPLLCGPACQTPVFELIPCGAELLLIVFIGLGHLLVAVCYTATSDLTWSLVVFIPAFLVNPTVSSEPSAAVFPGSGCPPEFSVQTLQPEFFLAAMTKSQHLPLLF